MPANVRKKMEKELRTAAKGEPTIQDHNKEAIVLSSSTQNLKNKNPVKKKKKGSSILHDHDLHGETGPQITHIEGEKWIKTLNKQTATKRKILMRHFNKEGSK